MTIFQLLLIPIKQAVFTSEMGHTTPLPITWIELSKKLWDINNGLVKSRQKNKPQMVILNV